MLRRKPSRARFGKSPFARRVPYLNLSALREELSEETRVGMLTEVFGGDPIEACKPPSGVQVLSPRTRSGARG